MSLVTLSMLAATAAILAAGLIFTSQSYLSRMRRRRFEDLQLIPNILMTRYPLMFVGRARSLFRLSGDFLELPIYLQEHGYQIEEIEIRENAQARSTLVRLLETAATPVHLIVGEAFASAAYDLALDGHAKLSTLTILGEHGRNVELRPSRLPVFERPELRPSLLANSFQTEEIALEHMVSLAEYDLR